MAISPKFPDTTRNIGRLKVRIKNGHVIHEGTDVVVNAASIDRLGVNGWGGVAGIIRDDLVYSTGRSGNEAQIVEADWKARREALTVGTADFVKNNGVAHKFHSTPKGKRGAYSKDYYLMHAGSPKGPFTSDQAGGDKALQLEAAYYNILVQMFEHNKNNPHNPIKSVAMIPLGIGIYGVDPAQSALCAANAIAKFYNDPQYTNAAFDITVPIHSADHRDRAFGNALQGNLDQLAAHLANPHRVPPLPVSNAFAITPSPKAQQARPAGFAAAHSDPARYVHPSSAAATSAAATHAVIRQSSAAPAVGESQAPQGFKQDFANFIQDMPYIFSQSPQLWSNLNRVNPFARLGDIKPVNIIAEKDDFPGKEGKIRYKVMFNSYAEAILFGSLSAAASDGKYFPPPEQQAIPYHIIIGEDKARYILTHPDINKIRPQAANVAPKIDGDRAAVLSHPKAEQERRTVGMLHHFSMGAAQMQPISALVPAPHTGLATAAPQPTINARAYADSLKNWIKADDVFGSTSERDPNLIDLNFKFSDPKSAFNFAQANGGIQDLGDPSIVKMGQKKSKEFLQRAYPDLPSDEPGNPRGPHPLARALKEMQDAKQVRPRM